MYSGIRLIEPSRRAGMVCWRGPMLNLVSTSTPLAVERLGVDLAQDLALESSPRGTAGRCNTSRPSWQADGVPDRPVLDPVEQRVLGALLEKQRTVPETYPLSLNALRAACNQATSRDPVVAYDETTIVDGLGRLRDRELVRFVKPTGLRVVKYHQRLEEHLALGPEQAALVTVLLLRGAQTAGRAADARRTAAPVRRPRGRRERPAAAGGRRAAAGPRAGPAAGPARPALDPPAGRRPAGGDRDRPAGRPRAGAGERRRASGPPGRGRVRPAGRAVRRRPGRRARRASRSTGGCWTAWPRRRPAVRASTSAADRARSPATWPSGAPS